LCAADRALALRRGKRAHRRSAVGCRAQSRGQPIGDAQVAQHLGEVDAGRRLYRVGQVNLVGVQKRGTQRVRIANRWRSIAAAHGDRRLDAADDFRRVGTRWPSRSSLAISAAVRIIRSAGAPASSLSRIAPTAPKVPSMR